MDSISSNARLSSTTCLRVSRSCPSCSISISIVIIHYPIPLFQLKPTKRLSLMVETACRVEGHCTVFSGSVHICAFRPTRR